MLKLLIVESNDDFAESLTSALSRDYQIRCCNRPMLAPLILQSFRPDCLIINLSLKGTDGLAILQQADYIPPAVLALSSVITPFIMQSAKDAGVSYILQPPCSTEAIVKHLTNMIRILRLPYRQPDPQSVIREHLRILGFDEHRMGFHLLCVGIPLYAQDPRQSFSKELYPSIAEICGCDSTNQVEVNIRRSITKAWDGRCQSVWEEYFPTFTERPPIRPFFAGLCEKLDLQQVQLLLAQNK